MKSLIYRSAAIKVVHEVIKEVISFDSLEDNFEAIDVLHNVEKRICNDLVNLSSAAEPKQFLKIKEAANEKNNL